MELFIPCWLENRDEQWTDRPLRAPVQTKVVWVGLLFCYVKRVEKDKRVLHQGRGAIWGLRSFV